MFNKLTEKLVIAVALLFGLTTAMTAMENVKEGVHKTIHHGCLNAIGSCENGHAEVRIDGNTMKLWFVGGGTDTDKAVRVGDSEITLAVTLEGQKNGTQKLVLVAKPDELAEEKVGDCSAFEGSAKWLKNAGKFVAVATIKFKGKIQTLRIEYPNGYDPD